MRISTRGIELWGEEDPGRGGAASTCSKKLPHLPGPPVRSFRFVAVANDLRILEEFAYADAFARDDIKTDMTRPCQAGQ